MRIAILILVAGCSVKADFTGTLYHCGDNDTCPTDYVCLNTYCVPESPGDAGVDANLASCASDQIALGLEHSCTLRSDGTAWCWGRNDYGQVGDGTLLDQTVPVQVMGLPMAKQLAAGSLHTCALDTTGSIWCWGRNNVGELGYSGNDSRVPTQIASITNALAVVAADQHTCALLSDHTVQCWGSNGFGQLGDNTTTDRTMPVAVGNLTNVAQLAAGGNTTCAVDTAGSVWCWGENDSYQCGNGDINGANVLVPTKLSLTNMASVGVGFYSACAASTSGGVSCWGDSSWGELGNGDYNYSDVPVSVLVPGKVVQIATGQMHVCVRDDQRRVWCWGDDEYNQFGDATNAERSTPVLAFTDVDAIATGGFDTCFDRGGALSCTGDNVRGELGFGQETATLTPTVSPALNGLTKLAAGQGFACGIAADATAKCWGNNQSGQLGDGTFTSRALPAPVFGLTGVTAIVAGFAHACALLTGGGVSCWGQGYQGQLGDGTGSSQRPIAEPVSSLGGPATQISAGFYHTCAVVGGVVKCWGRGSNNALDTGNSNNQLVPFTVPTLTNVVQVAAGDSHTCALKTDHTVSCWGYNGYGQLGNGTTMVVPGIVQVGGINNASELRSFADYNCARVGSSVVCWGEGYEGRLGNGTSSIATTPVAVLDVSTATALYTGPDHACVLRSDNMLACWGIGGSGQIGDNSAIDHLAPTTLLNTPSISSAAVGNGFTCATRSTDGAVLCWGDNHQGQLGDGIDLSTTTQVRSVALTCP